LNTEFVHQVGHWLRLY